MSDAYKIGKVTITPMPGGYYELKHSSLQEPEKVRGKEAAEARAAELGKTDQDDGSHMQPQGNNLEEFKAAPRAEGDNTPVRAPTGGQAANAAIQGDGDQNAADQGDDKDKALADAESRAATAEAAVKEMSAKFDELMKALKPVTTVVADAEPEPAPSMTAIPTRFEGEFDSDAKKALKAAGVTYSKIILEEGDHVPPTGLFVSVNDRPYMIKPGEEVDVPDFILEVLDNARMSSPIVDTTNQKVLGYRDRSRYPYRKV